MEKNSIFQFIKFMLLSLIASAVEFLTFLFCNFVLFKGLSKTDFYWLVFEYPVSGGGLCSFLSFVVSFTAAQITNFIVQRNYTFKSTGNNAKSAIMYGVMVVIMYFYVLWLPSLIGPSIYSAFGLGIGAALVKIISQFSSALIQFPLNKFLIMK